MVTILKLSEKMAAQNLPQIKVIWHKGSHGTIFVHDVRIKILSPDYIADVVMGLKFGNSSIYMR